MTTTRVAQRRAALSLAVATVSVALAGCGKLSKEDAEAAIEAKYFTADKLVQVCTWDAYLEKDGTGTDAVYTAGKAQGECVEALLQAQFVKKEKCVSADTGRETECEKPQFKIAGANVTVDQNRLNFPCGRKRLVGVNSVTTDGKKATVKYERLVNVDLPLLDKLKACEIKAPKGEAEERTMTFIKTDDGNWTINE